jgi:phenylalanyl-tRNA synthetase beta chain
MKASYRWLKALVTDLKAPPREVAERLTRAGLEVEGVHAYGAGLETLVVAAVRKIEPHPNRSGLRLVTVDRGEGHEQRVICGAPNVPDPGGLVALAPLGTHLPARDLTIGAREIGGVTSEGMLCSESEMGLLPPGAGGDEGILVLDAGSAAPGTPFLKAMPAAGDTIFEIGVTPNRPDALGHVGIAREVAALYGLPFGFPAPESPTRVIQGKVDAYAKVTVEDYARCPHYGAAVVVDVKVGPSPAWLRYRLSSLGVRPISNVVDITNLVLFEFGHPIHAFDLDRVRGSAIIVRRARAGEQIKTLDGVGRELDADDLVICDAEGPVALAGVMGGEGSEINSGTKRVLIECAYFTPRGVRRSSRRHGLHTESSHRFERGVDRGDTPDVLAHAASLIVDLAHGAAVPGAIHKFEDPPRERVVTLRSMRLDALLGAPVPFGEATAILRRLGFKTQAHQDDGALAQVTVPTFRPDVEREADLIEEVARIRGLDAIPTVLPAIRPQPARDTGLIESRVRDAATSLGLSEAITYGFVSPKDLEALGAPPSPVVLKNPLSDDRSVMRTSLLPGLLEAVKRAWRHGETEARLFTVGALFAPGGDHGLPREVSSFAAVLAGSRQAYLSKAEPFDVYDAKGVGVDIAERVAGMAARVVGQVDKRAAHLHPRGAANILIGEHQVGQIGPLHPDVLRAWDLDIAGVVVVELDLAALARAGRKSPRFSPIPRLPAATRDIALVVHDDVPAGQVERLIRDVAGDLCESVQVFDVFRGGSVPADHRSLAFHVVYRDPRAASAPSEARTLTDQEVDERHAAVVAKAKAELGATLRV